jgi:hypothetical protein
LTWRWQIATTSLFTGIDEASVKALFVDAVGEKIGNILSNRITDTPGGDPPGVPEPSTNTLITIACAGGVLLFLNRRENKKQ